MKIGAKEMKKAYKDVKLDQIDVCWLHIHIYIHSAIILYINGLAYTH